MRVRHLFAVLCCAAASAAAADIDPALLAGFRVRSIGPAGMSGRMRDRGRAPTIATSFTPGRRPAESGSRPTAD
jgi:hypothetical protein